MTLFHRLNETIKFVIKKIVNIHIESAWKGGMYKEYHNNCADADCKVIFNNHKNDLGIEICPVYNNKNGIVTIISDDGDYHTALQFEKLTKKYSIPVTISGIVTWIYPRRKEWKKILKNDYIELINHSYNHYRMDNNWKFAKDENKLIHELNHSQLFFNKYFDTPQYLFVCPENIICDLGLEILKKRGVIAIRGYGPGYNSLSIEDGDKSGQWLNLNSFTIVDFPRDESKNLREMRNQWLIEAASGKWLIEQWHNIDTPGFQTISFQEAEQIFADIKEHSDKYNLWIASFSDAVKYLKECKNADICSWVDNDYIYVVVIIDDCNHFDTIHPLSIMINKNTVKEISEYNILNNDNLSLNVIKNVIPNKLYKFRIDNFEEVKI